MNGLAAKSYWMTKMPQVPHPHTELDVEAMERKYTRKEEMGDQTNHWTLCTWKKHGTERSTIYGTMSQVPSRNGRQITYTQVPSTQCKSPMDDQLTET